jgi:organic hydroperoxide reductase OsmC/OhrA
MADRHVYRTQLAWSGTTAVGYEAYDRSHEVSAPPAQADLALSSDPAFRGDPARLNPEQLLVASASSCQLLSFLAIAARSGVEVVSYTDAAEGVMPENDLPVRITRILLRPTIVVAGDVPEQRVRRIVEKAHEECYIANSLRTEIEIHATIEAAARR